MKTSDRVIFLVTKPRVSLFLCVVGFALGSGNAWAGKSPGAGPQGEDQENSASSLERIETSSSGIQLSGYIDAGYVYQFIGGGSTAATQGYSADGRSRGDFNLNALKLVLEKPLNDVQAFQAGFRTDLMFGEDAGGFSRNTAAEGSSDTIYVQQGYVVVRAPWGQGLDVQVGRINSILGFEADERPANLNITQGLNASLDPGPAAGVQLTYPITKNLTLLGGIHNGHGQDTNAGLDATADGYALNAGLAVTNAAGNAQAQVAFQAAPWGDRGPGQTENEPLYGVNAWGTWAPMGCQDKLLLAINSSLWTASHFSGTAGDVNPGVDDGATFCTIAIYAQYQFHPAVSLAGRCEYAHTDDNQFLGLEPDLAPAGSTDVIGGTLTLGFDLLENFLLRVEYRVDAGTDVVTTGGSQNDSWGHMIATQAAFSF